MAEISLTQSKIAIIDDEDLDKIAPYKWCYHSVEGYAIATVYGVNPNRKNGQTTFSMHRVIADTPKGMQTDHINGNKLDNRKSNLRVCTKLDNSHNAGLRINNTSGYKGVYFEKDSKKWKAQISNLGKRLCLGRFQTAKEAAKAYNEAAIEYYGEFARLNTL